jgi:undecaprenyl diphosphate synthase
MGARPLKITSINWNNWFARRAENKLRINSMTPPLSSFSIAESTLAQPLLKTPRAAVCVPRHLAVAADFSTDITSASVDSLASLISPCLDQNIAYLSIMVSHQGGDSQWLKALTAFIRTHSKILASRGVRIAALTTSNPAARSQSLCAVLNAIEEAAELPVTCERLRLNLLVQYDGRAEILNAARRLADEISSRRDVEPKKFIQQMLDQKIPPVDLLIHTAGHTALSDLLLWQAAYAELLFINEPWSEFRSAEFNAALTDYSRRRRTFGALPGK